MDDPKPDQPDARPKKRHSDSAQLRRESVWCHEQARHGMDEAATDGGTRQGPGGCRAGWGTYRGEGDARSRYGGHRRDLANSAASGGSRGGLVAHRSAGVSDSHDRFKPSEAEAGGNAAPSGSKRALMATTRLAPGTF